MDIPQDARWRVAEAIAGAYAADPAVTTVLCGGSTGRGHADRWSDLEVGVFRSRPPDATRRRQIITDLGGADPRLFDYDPDERTWFDEWWWGGGAGSGLLVEVVHLTTADAHALLDQLPEAGDVPQILAAALAHGRPLIGSAEDLAARVRDYPRSVAAAVILRHGQIDHFWRWQVFVERQNAQGLRAHFAAVVTTLARILCALNGRWWPGGKWLPRLLADLPVAPERLTARLAEVDRLPPDQAAAGLARLVEQTYDLVEEHLPEVDVDRLRAIFRFARAPWPQGIAIRQ